MKFIKRTLLVLLLRSTISLLFRARIYRSLGTYHSLGQRANYSATDADLVSLIRNSKDLKDPDVREIISQGLSITRKQLHFTAEKNDIDPNKLITSRSAHCAGYATFFATSCNFLLEQHGLSDLWVAKPQIGQLYFLGTNVHSYFSSPFFKDHDFVSIENKKTGVVFAVDPTVNDYLWIDLVTYRK